MRSPLLWKEWRQLRMLRWNAAAIGIFLPLMLLALATAGESGWLFESVAATDAATVVGELTPFVLALAIWPLLAAMVVASASLADRASGTDPFLLARPVARAAVWRSRIGAAAATLVFVFACHSVVWWLAVSLVDAPNLDRTAVLFSMLARGGVLVPIAFLATLAACSFVRNPVQGLLMGVVLTAIPVGVGSLLTGPLFLGYRLRNAPLGFAVPLLLLIAYLGGSFLAECRGEPAGGGRARRAGIVLGVGLVAMPLFLAASAPLVMRWDARLGLGNTVVIPSPAGGAAVVLNQHQRAGWLIDTDDGRSLQFLPPPLFDVAWSDDGETLAILHAAGGSGRMLADPLLELIDRSGRRIARPLDCTDCRTWWGTGMNWSGETLAIPAFSAGVDAVRLVDTKTGRAREVPVPSPARLWRLAKARAGGELSLVRFIRRKGGADAPGTDSVPPVYGVMHSLDVAGAAVEPGVEFAELGTPYFTENTLSPSGRHWLRRPARRGEPLRVIDLSSRESAEVPARTATWLAGDRLAWLDDSVEGTRSLMVGRPESARVVGSFESGSIHLVPSPDGSRLLVTGRASDGRPDWRVYDVETDRWHELDPIGGPTTATHVEWAAAGKLAVISPGALALIGFEKGSEVVAVIGRLP